ncbi:glycosyltransferase family 2 protein [Candidatus Peregrinibacteria bacterium]|nr:glycosyltransferase family 2 protein [Candidatus Peregrinibacteria bacterium]
MSNSPKIAIAIIHYGTPQFIKSCLDSITTQTNPNIEIFFIDNNSADTAWKEIIKENYGNRANLKVIANDQNLGYAKAANQGIRLAMEAQAKYAVITNPDIIYSPQYFEKIVDHMEKNPKIAAITGKIYHYDFDRERPTNIIDTVGLFAYKNRRVIDDGQGLIDEGQFDEECEVFGVSGACPLYRIDALEDVKIMDEYMDEDFFMYKEDVDLSWRFLLYGWKNLYYPAAVAYHGRGTGVHRRFFNKEIIRHRHRLSRFQKKFAFTNQHLMQVKNELWQNFFKDFAAIVKRKLGMAIYITFREPYLWGSYLKYLRKLPRALKKRSIIMKNRRATVEEMGKWFQKQSKYLLK